jgi:RND family efflux transporter MFP subunit
MIKESSGADAGASDAQAPNAGGRSGGGRGGPGRSSTTAVVTSAIELQPYESIYSAIGTASALRSVNVVSDTAGTVIETNLAANREVEKGDVLVRFDARTEALNLEIAQAELERAIDVVSRYERLQKSGNSTVTDVALSEARVDQRLAEAAVGLAQAALDDQTIRAPISGRLGLSEVEVGETLSANTEIVTIDQSDVLVVEFELPERAIGLLATAKEISASTPTFTGRVFKGKIVSFDSRIDSVTRSVTVKAQIDNSDNMLWPGMTFAVRLTQLSAPLPMLRPHRSLGLVPGLLSGLITMALPRPCP